MTNTVEYWKERAVQNGKEIIRLRQGRVMRYWIDAPSKAQAYHSLHGRNVLACPDTHGFYRVYFLEGDVISQQIAREFLVEGWNLHRMEHDESQHKERRRVLTELFTEVQQLTNVILGSPPETPVKGEIESKALSLGHHPYILNPESKL